MTEQCTELTALNIKLCVYFSFPSKLFDTFSQKVCIHKLKNRLKIKGQAAKNLNVLTLLAGTQIHHISMILQKYSDMHKCHN
jgi:hypothetical protein